MKQVKKSRSDKIGSDLKEINIFVGLTMIIFFVAVGYPTLLNTNPTFGYEGIEWTPVTSYYQEAYAQQEVMQTLATINFNPIVASAFLVIPTTLDNPPPDPAQYFELKYGQPITIEQGFAETVRPEMIVVSNYELMLQRGSWTPIAWKEFFYLVEKPVFENIDDDFSPNPLIPSAYADSVYVLPVGENRIRNDIADQSSNCLSNALPLGGAQGGAGANVQHIGSAIGSGFCHFTVYTINPNMPRDIISDESVTLLGMRGRQTVQDSNYDCGIARLQGVYAPHASIGEMSASETWHNATSPKIAWSPNFNSPLCRSTFPQFVGTDVGYNARQSGLDDFIDSFESNTHVDGSVVCDPTDETQCFYSIALIDGNVPIRQGSSKDASWASEYFKITLAPVSNATDGHWQMKEHSFYPTGTMDDCGFSRIGDLFRIDSGATDAEQGQCVIFKTFNKTAVGTPDVSVFLNASGTGSSEMRVFVDVMDGAMNMGNLYSGTTTAQLTHTGDMSENILRVDLGTGQNHRLGITEVDLPFEGEILIKPEYSSGSENFFTVFVGLQDNSTDGTIILDINNATIGVNINNFSKPIVRFNEHTSNFANPSPIKTELDTGYVSGNVTQVTGLSLNAVDNSTAPNAGSLGSSADGVYFEDDSESIFVVNASGIVNEGIIQNGTSSLDTQGEVRFGVNATNWNFLHQANVGSNITSINFWINGDVVGAPAYPILDTKNVQDNTVGFSVGTLDGTNVFVRAHERNALGQINVDSISLSPSIPADDGQWHMVTIIMNKGNTTSDNVFMCIDGETNCGNVASGGAGVYDGTKIDPSFNLTLGSAHGAIVTENTWNIDELTIWNGYQVTITDVTNMWNSGVGASSDGIGASFQVLDVNFDLQIGAGQGVVAPALPNPNPISGGSVTATSSLLVDWIHDGINTTGYRIYRTSTEVNDTKVIFDTTTTEDFDVDLNSFESVSAVQSSIPAVEGEMISDFDILLMNDTGNPVTSEGFVRGAVFIDATISSGSNATLATSLFNPSGTAFLNTVTLPSGLSAFNFKFRGENLVNITTAFPLDIGIGVFANTSFTGDVSVGLCTAGCIGAGTPRVFNATSGVWEETSPTDDLVLRVSAVNQSKLFSPAIPLVNDTGSLDTSYLDNMTSSQNTFLYRIVALNGNQESDTIVILNGTEGLNINQTASDVAIVIDAGVNALFEIEGDPLSACTLGIGTSFLVGCYTFDTDDFFGNYTNLGTFGSNANAIYFESGVRAVFESNSSGIINQAVFQNGTGTGGVTAVIELADNVDQFAFLHQANVGDNVTSINFWINGDVVGDPNYPIFNTGNSGTAGAGFSIWTQGGTMRAKIDEVGNQMDRAFINSEPPDDGQWHMISVIMDKGNTTGIIKICLNETICAFSNQHNNFTGTLVDSSHNLTIGGGSTFGSGVTENGWNVDDLTIWQGYALTPADLSTLYNSGAGSTGRAIETSSQVVHLSFDDADFITDEARNLGTFGTNATAQYFSDDVLSPFVINATGKIEQAVIQNGTSSLDTQGEIRFGSFADRGQWDFIHRANVGSNLTSINFWLLGDVVGAPEYPILGNSNATGGNQNGFLFFTRDFGTPQLCLMVVQDGVKVTSPFLDTTLGCFTSGVPADDGQFHMVTLLMDKGNSTSFATVCVDGSTNCSSINVRSNFTAIDSTAEKGMLYGGATEDSESGSVTENTFHLDDLAIWNGIILTNTDIDNLLVGNVTLSDQTTNQTIIDTVTGTDQVQFNVTKILSDIATVLDQVNVTKIGQLFNVTITDTAIVNDLVNVTKIGQLFNVTITDIATASDQTATKLQFVPIDNLEVYWKFDHITPTFESEFINTTEWSQIGTEIQIDNSSTSGHLAVRSRENQDQEHGLAHQFSANVSNTNWVVRFSLQNLDCTTPVFSEMRTWFGIANTDETVMEFDFLPPLTDSLGFFFGCTTAFNNPINLQTTFSNDARAVSNNDNFLTLPQSPRGEQDWYLEIIRNSATSATWNFYNDAGYTDLRNSTTRTIPSTIDDMDFIKFTGDRPNAPNIGIFDWNVDNVKFWNGTSDINSAFVTEDFANIPDADSSTVTGAFNKTQIGILGLAWESPPTGGTHVLETAGTPQDYAFFNDGNSTINMWISDESCVIATERLWATAIDTLADGVRMFVHCNILGDETMEFQVRNPAVSGIIEISPLGYFDAQANKFTMYTIVHDNTNNQVLWYKNATLVETDPTVLDDVSGATIDETPFFFNADNPVVGYNNATIDEWSFWSRTLSSTEISTLYNDGFGLMLNNFDAQQNPPLLFNIEITDTVTANDLVNVTKIGQLFNVTITDIATASDQTATKLPFVPIDNLEVYWKFDHITPTFESEFIDTTEWEIDGTEFTIDNSTTSGHLEVERRETQNGIHGAGHKFSANVSDTSWVLRFDIQHLSCPTAPDQSDMPTWIGISNTNQSVNDSPLSDAIGITLDCRVAGGGDSRIRTAFSNEQPKLANVLQLANNFGFGDIYFEIIRNSATSVTWNFYRDSGYTDLFVTDTRTIPSAIDVMDNFNFNADNINSPSVGVFNWNIDKVKFWNATTDIHTTLDTEDFANIPDADSSTITGAFNKTQIGILGLGWESPDDETHIVRIGGTPQDYDFFTDGNSTANFWIKEETCDTGQVILATVDTSNADGTIYNTVDCQGANRLQVRNLNSVAVNETGSQSLPNLFESQADVFFMYTVVFDDTNNLVNWYKNGQFIASNSTGTDDVSGAVIDQTPYLWNANQEVIGFNNATFDEFSLWSRTLNSTEISDLYNAGFGLMLNNFAQQQQPPVFNASAIDTATVSDQVTVKTILDTTDLEAYWKFEETSGNMTSESFANIQSAGSKNDTDITKTVTGKFGNAWRSSATSQGTMVSIGGSPSEWDFLQQDDVTWNWWMTHADPANAGDAGHLWSTRVTQTGDLLFLDYDSANHINYLMADGLFTRFFEESPNFFLDLSCRPDCTTFEMYTITKNNTSGEVKWYRNGTLSETDTGGDTSSTNTPQSTPTLFSQFEGDEFFQLNNATLDEFSVWSRVLTTDEVTALFNNGDGFELTGVPQVIFNATAQDTATVSDEVTVIKQLVSTEDLFGYWKFDNAVINDMISTNPPATIPDGDVSNSVLDFTIVDGIIGTAYARGSADVGKIDLGAVGNRAQYDFLVGHEGNITTWNWWMIIEDIDPTVQQQFIMTSWTDDFNPAGIQIVADTRDAGNLLQFDARKNLGSIFMLEQVNNILQLDSQFHMYTIVWDVDGFQVKWYLDGVLFETDTTDAGARCQQVLIDLGQCIFENTLQIADIADNSPQHECEDCTFDELSIWKRGLTQEDITNLFNSGFGLELENQQLIFNTTDLEAYWKFEETSGILKTEDFVNIPDADSINDVGMNKTNTGVFGNAWRTADLGGARINITGSASDWDFIQSGSHSYNLWMQVPDPDNGLTFGILFETRTAVASNGAQISLVTDFTERLRYFIGKIPVGDILSTTEVSNYWDNTCKPNCTSYQMVTLTANGTSGLLKWYANGTLIQTDNVFNPDPTQVPTAKTPMLLASTDGSFSTNKASFDEWSIWSRVLTPTEITTLFNNGDGLELKGVAPPVGNQTLADVVVVVDNEDFIINKTIRNVEIFSGGTNGTIFADNFTNYQTQGEADGNWTTTDTSTLRVNISNDELDFNLPTLTTQNAGIVFDLNQTINPEWALRFKLDIATFNINSDPTGQEVHVGISSADETFLSNNVNQDYIGLKFSCAVSVCTYDVVGADGQAPTTGGAIRSTFSRTPSAETIFVEIIRNSTTSVVVHQYSDVSYNTILESSLATIPSGITDLQFVKLMGKNSDGTANGDILGSIDDVYLVEYDFFDQFSGTDDWSDTGTKMQVNTTRNAIDWDGLRDGTNHATSFDLGAGNVDDVSWKLRFSLLLDSLTSPSAEPNYVYIALSDSDHTVASNVAQDFVTVVFQAGASVGLLSTFGNAGTTGYHVPADIVFTDNLFSVGTPIFVEMERTSTNSFEISLFSDPLFSVLIEKQTSTNIDSTVDSLRFIKVQNRLQLASDGVYTGIVDDITFINGAGNTTLTFFTGDLVTVTELLNVTKINATGVNFNQTATDNVIVLDQEEFDITKLFSDTATSSDTDTITFNPVPNSINNLVAFAVGDTCELTWSSPINLGDPFAPINGYKILKSVAGGSFNVLIANTSSTLTAFNDTGLLLSADHDYDVRALNKHGEAVGSNIDTCVPQPSSPPNSPTLLIATAVGTNVQLDWTASTEGSPSGYFIERKIDGGGYIDLVLDTASTSTTFLDNSVTPATKFFYRVSAINAFGISAPSNEAPVTTLETPNKPTLFAVQNVNQIDLSWTLPTSDSPINGFRIEKRINFGLFFDLVSNTTNTNLTLIDDNVTAGNVYGFRVRGLSEIGTGSVSNIVDVNFGSHVIVEVREQDGTSYKGGGTVRMENSTFSTTQIINGLSNANFDNFEVGNYNFTFIDLDNFILNKTINFPFPSGNLSSTFEIRALVFDVDCPSNGGGTDVRIKVNYTNLHDITQFPSAPVCDSSDKVSWSTTWGGSEFSANSTMIADFISVNFMENAEQFLVSTVPTGTSYDSVANRITSESYGIVPQIPQTSETINFDLFLDMSPPQGGSGGGGGGTAPFIPSITPRAEDLELTGLSLLSRTHQFAQAGDVIRGVIDIQWEGEDPLTITRITIGDFRGSMVFLDTPRFDIPQSIEGSGEFAMSSGSVAYVITLPPQVCQPEIGLDQNCLIEELFSIPVEFEFEFKGQVVSGSTNVMVDARPIPFDIVQLQVILLGILLIGSALAGNFIRQRLKKQRKPASKKRRKFKKKFDSS